MPTYLVTQTFHTPKSDQQERERLIEAPKKSDAIRKVAEETISAEVAETADIVRLAKAGVELETVE